MKTSFNSYDRIGEEPIQAKCHEFWVALNSWITTIKRNSQDNFFIHIIDISD